MAFTRERASGLPDGAARDEIRTALDVTLLVEAGAGSGKTTMLVDRMLALLAAGKAGPENLAAVTFTRKAASHLRRRFQTALESAARSERDAARARRLHEARGALDRLTLGTIDSFCALLLSERPLEAGIDPAALRVELQEAALFRARTFREYVGTLADAHSSVASLFALGVTMKELEDSFELYAEYPDVVPVVSDPLALPDFKGTREEVEDFLERAIPLVPPEPGPEGRDDLQTKLLEARALLQLPEYATPAGFARLLRTLRPHGGATQKRWPDKALAKRLGQEYESLRQNVVKPALAEWQLALHERIYGVLRPALAHLAARRAGKGPFTYADLLLATRDVLRDFPAVRRAFARRFTHLLVDEFQDTDPLQAEILLYLTSDDLDEKDVSRLKPRAGSLFVVGDPKQSIYRFRRADIAAYMNFRRTLVASGGRIVRLEANFRAVPTLTDPANVWFRSLFPEAADDRQASFAPLEPVRKDRSEKSGAFRLFTPSEGAKAEETACANASQVARFVRAAVDHGWPVASDGPERAARFGDFLVLTRTREHLDVYARAFEALGIPADVSGSRALPISKGLTELRPFLAAIQDPDDDVSVVAFLSGPLSGVDDDALYRFHRDGGRFSYLVEPPPGTDKRISRGLDLLAKARKDVNAHPAGAALGLICDRLGLVARLAAGPEGRTASGNLLKVLALARRFTSEGLSFRDVVERLAEDAPSLDLEEMSIEPVDADAVRLMNLHRAKGLEAPIVVLAELGNWRKADPKRHVARGAAGSRGWFTAGYLGRQTDRAPSWNVTATPPDWENRRAEEAAFEEAEKTRLLYVAATRARDALIVSLREDKPEAGAWAPLRSGLKELPAAVSELRALATAKTPPLAAELAGARRGIAEGRLRTAAASYAVTPVTALAKKEGPRAPSAAQDARGAAWGRVLHQLLEAAMRTPGLALRPVAENLLREEELGPELLDEVIHVAESVTSSPLWARARASKRRFVEAPFAMMVPSADLGVSIGPEQTLLKGAIDLVFEEDGVWHIVDWKSDAVGDNLAELVAHYAPQITHYRKAWEALTKQRAVAGLYFMDNGHLEWLEEGRSEGASREEKEGDSLKGVERAAEPEAGASQAQGRRPVQASLPFEED
ncbi:MAG TPA: UvrD-helicase domain-containing protein [Thermoanaerobaculia bacterium]|nr:UvrD-helicase domain-containing protein [Thermoanaerobaculia bacterium]